MHSRALLALCLVVASLGAGASAAATQETVLSASPTAVEAQPGDRVPMNVTVTHSGENTTAYIVDLDTPAGFTVENASYQFYQDSGEKWLLGAAAPGRSISLTFDLRVPPDASGTYELPIVAKTAAGVQSRVEVTVDTPGERTATTTATAMSPTTDETATGTSVGAEPSADSSGTTADGPGFGVVAALVGALLYALARRASVEP